MSDIVHVIACRLCGGDLDLVVSFIPTPPGDQYLTEKKEQPCYPLDLMCCQGCGAVQLADTVDPALIYPEYLYTTSVSRGLDTHFDKYAQQALERANWQAYARAWVVDIGSNDGTLLKSFQRRGCEVFGIEPAQAIAHRSGVPTWTEFFSEELAHVFTAEYRQADIITANHVMANVADLHDFADGVKELLAPNGTFVFETGYWPAIVDGNLIDTIEHEHIHYFAAGSLQRFFDSHGLTLVHVETNNAKGGSLRGYVQHAGATSDDTVAVMVVAEAQFGYADIGRLGIWVDTLNQLEQGIRRQALDSYRETWVGYGAATGSTLQLHQFGLGDKLLCLVDDNPAKQGRLSPGYHLNVLPPSELNALNPDRIVILAWRYAEMIQQQHPEFAGKWIVPLPSMVTA